MARYYGKIGYGHTVETEPGVTDYVITEQVAIGDTLTNSVKSDDDSRVISNLTLGNSFSIVGNEYAVANAYAIKYVEWTGVLWTVTDVKVLAPRLILRPGEVYNGPTPEIPDSSGGTPGE